MSVVGNRSENGGESPCHFILPFSTNHIGRRRLDCWWEPIYNPNLSEDEAKFEKFNFQFNGCAGPYRKYISGYELVNIVDPGSTYLFSDRTFVECDFQGRFAPNAILMFENCRFIRCDFAYSSWRDAHFKKCKFEGSSLSLALFERCEFRDCEWENVGISSKTEFEKCYNNQVEQLVSASVSYTRAADNSSKHRRYQWYRLHGTRANFLRKVVLSHQASGDENNFYATIRLYELQRSKSLMSKSIYEILHGNLREKPGGILSFISQILEYIVLRVLGFVNNWGSSVSRPIGVLAALYGLFWIIYRFWFDLENAFQRSFDITLLVGYTNHSDDKYTPVDIAIAQDIHVGLSIAVYSILLATIVSRISRVR